MMPKADAQSEMIAANTPINGTKDAYFQDFRKWS
jgi:hypothetical protein